MATIITVPQDYGYVLMTVAGTFFLSQWQGMRCSSFRKAAGIPYPQAYAECTDIAKAPTKEKKTDMHVFNCAQRSHGNLLENLPAFSVSMLVAGLNSPQTVAGMGVAWIACRIAYAIGYTKRDVENGKGRLAGSGFWFLQWAMFGMTAWTGYKMLA